MDFKDHSDVGSVGGGKHRSWTTIKSETVKNSRNKYFFELLPRRLKRRGVSGWVGYPRCIIKCLLPVTAVSFHHAAGLKCSEMKTTRGKPLEKNATFESLIWGLRNGSNANKKTQTSRVKTIVSEKNVQNINLYI